MPKQLGRRPAADPATDDLSAHRELVREFNHRLAGLHKQALWLDMPFVAHFIGVAALGAADAEPDLLPGRDAPVD